MTTPILYDFGQSYSLFKNALNFLLSKEIRGLYLSVLPNVSLILCFSTSYLSNYHTTLTKLKISIIVIFIFIKYLERAKLQPTVLNYIFVFSYFLQKNGISLGNFKFLIFLIDVEPLTPSAPDF